jgi:hypothetical protein
MYQFLYIVPEFYGSAAEGKEAREVSCCGIVTVAVRMRRGVSAAVQAGPEVAQGEP